MGKLIKIGTRDSELALWQAHTVQRQLEALGHTTVLVTVKSDGDLDLDTPLYELGITGIFTKTLDVALLKGQIDIAVHSMKDVPTALPKGIVQTAVLERAQTADVLVHLGKEAVEDKNATIATGSLRRKAQWLHRYPDHTLVDLRGNVNTRLLKLIENGWQGAIFAKAGLQRIKLLPKDALELDWMLPAPAQGAMMVVALENNIHAIGASAALNHAESALTTFIEREFLRTLEGGCTAPIGALAQIQGDTVIFEGALFSLDGTRKIRVQRECMLAESDGFGAACAKEILQKGGSELMMHIKNEINPID